ncbi:hypothetical protein [Enterococcus sp.]|uniref:hypothetical protein n=1 Tax=Enterococcus sp. TaxID=35783 RepID=UPI0025BD3EBB|nr:hypothetical protein [Enterococcus sp.]
MNKKVCFGLYAFFCSLLLASCGQENQAIKTSEPTSSTATKLSSTHAENIDLMLIQEESSQFPQSQGVYDLQGKELTIVKQYLPMTENSNDENLSGPALKKRNETIQADFDKNFSSANLRLKDDPFEIYETTFQGASFSIDGKTLYLRADGLELKFHYDEATNRAYDENNVRYEVQVDQ